MKAERSPNFPLGGSCSKVYYIHHCTHFEYNHPLASKQLRRFAFARPQLVNCLSCANNNCSHQRLRETSRDDIRIPARTTAGPRGSAPDRPASIARGAPPAANRDTRCERRGESVPAAKQQSRPRMKATRQHCARQPAITARRERIEGRRLVEEQEQDPLNTQLSHARAA